MHEQTEQTAQNVGWAWHVHHAEMCPIEWCYDMASRRYVIDTAKPPAQREVRHQRLQWVRGTLPAAFVQAGAASVQARDAFVQARDAYVQARAAYDQASAAYDQASAAAMPAILALHAQECVGCAWTPAHQSIFPSESPR